MSNNVAIYQNDTLFQGQIRVVTRDGEPWIVAKDVAQALGYASNNMTSVFQAVPDEWKGSNRIATLGGEQQLLMLSEAGLYFFLSRSDKEKALPFQKWLAGTVLPSLRKTGHYTMPGAVPAVGGAQMVDDLAAARMIYAEVGLEGNQMALAMDKYLVSCGRRSALAAAEVRLVAPAQCQLLTPTELGGQMNPPRSARSVNRLLEAAGLQTRLGNGTWEPTEEGRMLGAVLLDVNKRHSHGVPVRQLKWPHSGTLLNRLNGQAAA